MADDNDGRKAGSIILRDLELFNRAAVFMEFEIQPVVHSEVDAAIKEWAETRGWGSGGDGEESFEELWVAPPQWHVEGDEWSAWFQLGRREGHDSNSYQIADLFGVGETEYGLRFLVDHGRFGGKAAWNSFSKTIGDLGQRLGERGWAHEGKGVFFRPLVLPAAVMAEAWANEDWTAALEPLGRALDALANDFEVFDELVARAAPREV